MILIPFPQSSLVLITPQIAAFIQFGHYNKAKFEIMYGTEDKYRQFGADLFLVSGYARKINHVIFGYIHCAQVAHYILERSINQSHFVSYVSLHKAILDQVASDFQRFALKEDEKTLTMFSKVMDNCGSVMIQSATNVGEQHPLLTLSFDFLVSNLTFFDSDEVEDHHEVIHQFIKDAASLLMGLIDLMPKPKELMNEGELAQKVENNKTTETVHELMVKMASTPILDAATYGIIIARVRRTMNQIAICEMYEASAVEQLETMRKVAWATGIVAQTFNEEVRNEFSQMMNEQFGLLIEPKFQEQVDLRCDAAFMLHKTGFVPKETSTNTFERPLKPTINLRLRVQVLQSAAYFPSRLLSSMVVLCLVL